MITEAQFTDAMERAVNERGSGWKYPSQTEAPPGFYASNCPTYQDGRGNPTCLVGAAMHVLGMKLPSESYGGSASALSVLGGVLEGTAVMAARCAQIHQDKSFTWGESLDVYKAALAIQRAQSYSLFNSMDLYYVAVSAATGKPPRPQMPEVTAMNELVAAFGKIGATAGTTAGIVSTTFASGGIVQKIGSPVSFTGTEVTFAFNEIPTSLYLNAFVQEPVLYKKEHALTA
jgi:hypothetical protein